VIEFVYFDADGTLFDLDAALRRALGVALEELRLCLPTSATGALSIEDLQADRDQAAAELAGVDLNLERIRLAGFTRTLERCGVPEAGLAERLTALFLEHRFTGTLPFDDVLPALDALGAEYRLGVLSNGNSHPDRCGLAGRFETVVLAQDHGVEKPDRRLYEIAAAAAALPPDRIAMIGDSYTDDVLGARNAGWHSIWLNRPATADDQRDAPPARIPAEAGDQFAIPRGGVSGDDRRAAGSGGSPERVVVGCGGRFAAPGGGVSGDDRRAAGSGGSPARIAAEADDRFAAPGGSVSGDDRRAAGSGGSPERVVVGSGGRFGAPGGVAEIATLRDARRVLSRLAGGESG
jgi:FMN hydrolase / 5-amino-6-(5-phospho-D-ribitylamino)uracil phosphatase